MKQLVRNNEHNNLLTTSWTICYVLQVLSGMSYVMSIVNECVIELTETQSSCWKNAQRKICIDKVESSVCSYSVPTFEICVSRKWKIIWQYIWLEDASHVDTPVIKKKSTTCHYVLNILICVYYSTLSLLVSMDNYWYI